MNTDEIISRLEYLLDDERLENGFSSKNEMLSWANKVAPLLQFHDEYYQTFQYYNQIINRPVTKYTGEPALRTMVSQVEMALEWLRVNGDFEGEDNESSYEEDIVELKPNFFGFGIDLRALWRKFFG
jgi:hypothetical protein